MIDSNTTLFALFAAADRHEVSGHGLRYYEIVDDTLTCLTEDEDSIYFKDQPVMLFEDGCCEAVPCRDPNGDEYGYGSLIDTEYGIDSDADFADTITCQFIMSRPLTLGDL